MLQDFLEEQRIAGYPSFACRADDGQGVVWWAPVRSGEPTLDYPAGVEHFRSTLGLVQALRQPDFLRHMITPDLAAFPPHGVLACIVNSMKAAGPMERGFLDALTVQAVAGRLPPLSGEDGAWLEEDQDAERYAHNCIEFARTTQFPEFVTDELVGTIDGSFIGTPRAFIWTVCRAATAGALN